MLAVVGCAGCIGDPPAPPEDTDAATDTEQPTTSGPSSAGTISGTSVGDSTTTDGTTDTADVTTATDATADDTTTGPTPISGQLDLVLVIDNSGTMGEEQRALGRNLLLLVERLEALTDAQDTPVDLDVQIMVTTTDFGNPLCTPFEPAGYDPAKGAPISTACTSRLQDFTDLIGTTSMPEACEDNCPVPIEPDGDFVAFDATTDNIAGDPPPVDVDGDGDLDSPAAQALACIGPQGLNGCGYESPLENMLQALNPVATWNQGAQPFLRDGAMLGLVIITDEVDCSVDDYTIMENPAFQNINPDTGMPGPSSAICWNAGVTCTGPDAQGVFSDCTSAPQQNLELITRYTDYLIEELRNDQGKEVFMLGIVGVPPVTAHSPVPPFEPTAGGVLDLVYRNWIDGQYPAGDILPDDFAMGETAADKQFDFGIGPGCTGEDGMGSFTGQALPPVRIKEVCEALDVGPDPEDRRCCLESVCDADYSSAITCLEGLVRVSL